MRIIVCGGRKYRGRQTVFDELDLLLVKHQEVVIYEGGGTGADTLAREWAAARGQQCITIRAKWQDFTTEPVVRKKDKNGRDYNAAAGGIRNEKMLAEARPELVLAFPGGSGTKDMVRIAKKAGVPCRIVN